MKRTLAGAGPALAAAALVEAAAGCFAAACLARLTRDGSDGGLPRMLEAVALAASLVDVALVPGWVWARGRFEIMPMLTRLGIALFALMLAVGANVFGTILLLIVVGTVWPEIPVGPSWYSVVVPSLFIALVSMSAGAIVGAGAAAAQEADRRSGPDPFPPACPRTHLLGGVAGLALTIGALAAADRFWVWVPALGAWPMFAILPPILVLVGLPHNALVLWDAVRSGGALPDAGTAMRRAAICAVVLAALGAGAFLTGL